MTALHPHPSVLIMFGSFILHDNGGKLLCHVDTSHSSNARLNGVKKVQNRDYGMIERRVVMMQAEDRHIPSRKEKTGE